MNQNVPVGFGKARARAKSRAAARARAALLGGLAFAMLAAPAANAQQAPPPLPPAPVSPPPAPTNCAPKAALYQAAKGPKLWVVRRGTMVLAENPLRPLARDEAVVLEVVVNGRRATAYGLDTANLHQGGSLKSVEREGREPIRWKEGEDAPGSLRVIAEDGRVLLGPMSFGGCEDPPVAKAIVDRPVKAEGPPERGKRKGGASAAAGSDTPPGHLPQGALDGLSLPKDGPRR